VTAKTDDGSQVFSKTNTYMPIPQQFGRGGRMGRGAYEKSGFLEDTSLPVNETVTEVYEIPVPGAIPGTKAEARRSVEVTAKLWYMPGGKKDSSAVLWREESRKVSVP